MPARHSPGWWVIGVFVVAHNLWAIRTGHEMLSETAHRKAAEHPLVLHIALLTLLAHLCGWMSSRDPISALAAHLAAALTPRTGIAVPS